MSSQPQPVFRFAPSPNGRLHLGHAYSALFTWHWAQKMNGQFLLRIEDIDPERSKQEFIEGIYEDMHWLGLRWPMPAMQQSKRFPIYQKALTALQEKGVVYPCFCSRGEITARARAADPDGAPLYTGYCKQLTDDDVQERIFAGKPVQWRLDVRAAAAQAGKLTCRVAHPDPEAEPQNRKLDLGRWGDVVVARKDVPASYHLSVVVDDAAQGVTHVTRGRDLEAATDIHVLLQALLGLPSPVYTFHRLVLDTSGEKLSKSKNAPTLKSLRDQGVSPALVRKRLGF